MIPESQIEYIRKQLEECDNPIFFFHDDPDGLSSFLLFYRFIKKGRGVCVKSAPKIDEKFSSFVRTYKPDKIFILDIAIVEQEFIDECNVPIIWIDHHDPLERDNIKYFNPRKYDKHTSVSEICYNVTKKDVWIACSGIVGDWQTSNDLEILRKEYPDLLLEKKNVEEILYDSKLGEIIKVMSFILKGKTKEVNENIKVMTRIEDPYEILNQTTPRGKFIFKRYNKINEKYDKLRNAMLYVKPENNVFFFSYQSNEMSFTKDLANEALYRFPNCLIIISREKHVIFRFNV